MMNWSRSETARRVRKQLKLVWIPFLLLLMALPAIAQMDQGTITGVVQDKEGAVIPGATVTLTNTDTGLVQHANANGSGIYVFTPVPIGNYKIAASSAGFSTTVQENLRLDVQQRLNVVLKLNPGAVSETVTVSTAPPPLQTQEASVGQVMTTETINDTPLNGRNWVFIAQLAAGVTPSTGSPAAGNGDFSANGQRVEQNDFILDGFDDNNGSFNFSGGTSYAVQPPPDALAEFKVQTADFSAEFGHSAGAVVNASIKSGTNDIHGDVWEYFRNNALDARNWNSTTIPDYRENQFGATLGSPIIRNKLFYFGYAEANRITYANTSLSSVPTDLMKTGDFSELLNPALTSTGTAIKLYAPGSNGSKLLVCGTQQNVICPGNVNPLAKSILALYPEPNTNGANTYNNYTNNNPFHQNVWQWGSRVDWNATPKDQAFARYTYSNEVADYSPTFGLPLDGGSYPTDGSLQVFNDSLSLSETHIFTPTLVNEFRFGFNYLKYLALQPDSNVNAAANLGLGGIPYTPGQGGLPHTTVTGLSLFGSPASAPNTNFADSFQIMDNVSKNLGKHSLRMGVFFQSMRDRITNQNPRGSYTYSGRFTSLPGTANTGFGAADFLSDMMDSASVSTVNLFHDSRWYRAAYAEDTWKVAPTVTLTLGLRYDFYQPSKEINGRQASFNPTGPLLPGSGQATMTYVSSQEANLGLAPAFLTYMTQNNVSIQYTNNPSLTNAQKWNFAPRLGIAWNLYPRTVIRAGYGIFYGGLESNGPENFLANYPFQFSSSFSSPSCTPGSCLTDGLNLETGFQQQISQGFNNFLSQPVFYGVDQNTKTPYAENYNLTLEQSLTHKLVFSLAYVGSTSHHLQIPGAPNSAAALIKPGLAVKTVQPFPTLGAVTLDTYAGASNYNSFQARVEQSYSNGLRFLSTYTWAHALDDATDDWTTYGPDTGYRAYNLIGINNDYSNSPQDIRQRVTVNAYYQLPFGHGKKYLRDGALLNSIVGSWAANLVFTAQTGPPITVSTNLGSSGPNGGTAEAIKVRDPFAAGGSPDPTNPTITCAQQTKTIQHWYNPCAFANPPIASFPTASTQITGLAALPYLGGRRLSGPPAPGLERVNLSMFKSFSTFREQRLEVRADAFNLLNTPSYGRPSTSSDAATGGQITAPQTIQSLAPDARFFQLSAKYVF
ncbi:TonB-dependent Receptor Plug Domain [Bryocella elongata]|uniref:TonB-dependent Receptor Plug Domain n=1 Tax=Bryocella elongata TaxID=863522 RepID=A0A1H6B952_9BACT|nr:TonB-dependent Receptor Plug Domain [Bryocella elongata]